MSLSIPWLFIVGLFLPVALAVPLLLEHRRSRDGGPRTFPTSTLDVGVEQSKATPPWARDPRVRPGLVRLSVDLQVMEGDTMEGNVVTDGELTIGREGKLRGSAKAARGIKMLAGSRVYGNLISGVEVDLGNLSYVQGIVYSVGNVTLRSGAVVKGIFTDGRVDVYPGAEILEEVIARQGVHLVVPVKESRVMEELEMLNALFITDDSEED